MTPELGLEKVIRESQRELRAELDRLRAELELTNCPLRMTNREICSAGSCYACLIERVKWQRDQLSASQRRVGEMETVLRFYANPWAFPDDDGDVRVPDFYSELDFGDRAQQALKGAPVSPLAGVLKRATDFIGYLLNHLPEDKRDNSVWLECRKALQSLSPEVSPSLGEKQ